MKKIYLGLMVFTLALFAFNASGAGQNGQDNRPDAQVVPYKGNEIKNYSLFDCGNTTDKKEELKCKTSARIREDEGNKSRFTGINCSNITGVGDRIRCRIKTQVNEKTNKSECAEQTGENQTQCEQKYQKTKDCWKKNLTDDRISCIKEKLNATDFQERKQECMNKTEQERGQCIADLKRAAYDAVLLRFENIEDRIQTLQNKSLLTTAEADEYTAQIEEQKIAFNQSKNLDGLLEAIHTVRDIWQEIIQTAKNHKKEAEQ
ncbi:Uncharacterised protein [uncultured archaeon]|nr:Uncharacterised protein [uncultured archaeon]